MSPSTSPSTEQPTSCGIDFNRVRFSADRFLRVSRIHSSDPVYRDDDGHGVGVSPHRLHGPAVGLDDDPKIVGDEIGVTGVAVDPREIPTPARRRLQTVLRREVDDAACLPLVALDRLDGVVAQFMQFVEDRVEFGRHR